MYDRLKKKTYSFLHWTKCLCLESFLCWWCCSLLLLILLLVLLFDVVIVGDGLVVVLLACWCRGFFLVVVRAQ